MTKSIRRCTMIKSMSLVIRFFFISNTELTIIKKLVKNMIIQRVLQTTHLPYLGVSYLSLCNSPTFFKFLFSYREISYVN